MKVYPSLTINASAEPMLSQGSSGNAVLQLQEALANAGFSPGAADGDFGPATRAALVRFQAANGLSQDGVAGPNTWGALARANNGASAAPAPAPSSGEPTLSKGATGGAVTTLQQDLNKDGFSTGGVDGIFGNNTLGAVEAFQRSRGLSVDGVVGANTWKALTTGAPAAPSAPSAPTSGSEPTVYEGSTGAAVSTMQQLLTNAGYSTGGVDGDFGPNTRAALMSFQSSHGLTDDGVCGPATWAALQSGKPASAPPTASGTNAASIAEQYLGQSEYTLEANGVTQGGVPESECCANFVSSMLEKVGAIGFHTNLVVDLSNQLQQQGWRIIPASEAKPGDVWICNSSSEQHTELVASNSGGKVTLVGSNNTLADGTQAIGYDGYSATIPGSYILAPP